MRILNSFFRTILLTTVCAIGLPWQSYAQTSSKAYGILLFDQQTVVNKLVSFPFPDMTSFEEIKDYGSLYLSAGVYYDGYYYAASNGYSTVTTIAEELFRINLETGDRESVGSFAGFSNKIADMTIDYSTGKCYAISGQMGGSGDPGSSALYTIDLNTAATKKIADLGNFYFTLACSYGGQLYGVSKYGNFVAIDKNTGDETVIGATTMQPTGDSSMEFDHTDKTLWWALTAMVNAGDQYYTEESCLCRIDVETGVATVVSLMGSEGDASIAGLYVPFTASADGTPEAVADFTVTPDANGACRAELSWVNPTTVFGGGTLTSINSVDIYRNDELIHSMSGMQPGEPASWTDEISGETGVLAKYEIVAVNDSGRGVVSEQTAFVGEDVPGKVENVKLSKLQPDEVEITWDAPAAGANGGWYDRSTLTYDIIRQPGDLALSEGLAANTFTDTDVPSVALYSYDITASTKAGAGTTTTSEEMLLGPVNELPYSCGFTSSAENSTWVIVDADNDGRTWVTAFKGGSMQYNNPFNSSTPADDWLISHDFVLEAGKNYKGTFALYVQSSAKLDVYLGQGVTVDAMTQQLYSNDAIGSTSSAYKVFEYTFSVAEDGIYNIGFHIYSDPATYYSYLTDVTLEELADNNVAVLDFNGPKNAVVGSKYDYKVEVLNKGTNPIDAFQVVLKDASGSTLASTSETTQLGVGESRSVVVEWTPAVAGETTVHAEAVYEKDEIDSDNKSGEMVVNVLPEGSADFIEIGSVEDDKFGRYYLFDVYNANSAALNIYTPEEMNVEEGVIESFFFTVKSGLSSTASQIPVKVYMANTDLTTATTWIPESEMTLVCVDTIDIAPGTNEMKLELQKKFYFEKGKNLAVLTTNDMSGYTYYNGVTYPYFTVSGTGTYKWSSSYTEFDFTQYGTAEFGRKASVSLQMRCNGGSITGIVSDGDGFPLAGAEVSTGDYNLTVTTNEEGVFELKYLPDGIYTLTVSKQNYAVETETVTVTNGADVELNVDLKELKVFTVNGIITTQTDEPIADAEVELHGYEDLSTTTDDEGRYTFETVCVVDEPYKIAVSKDWFANYEAELPMFENDAELDPIKLDYLKFAPVNVSTASDGDAVTVTWQGADNITTLRTDDGKPDMSIGITNGNSATVIGSIYKEPMALTEVSWYQSSVGGPHYYVNVFILALDEEGNPTSEVLYTKSDVNTTDETWVTYELPDTVYAPNGCVVGLSYIWGYVGIGIDSGKDLIYPFQDKTHVFAANYANGEFDFIESRGYENNLMIRAKGLRIADNGEANSIIADGETLPDYCKYMVWRLKSGNENAPDRWIQITDAAQAEMTLTDDLANTAPGLYRYAVRTVYPDGSMSEYMMSPLMEHSMKAAVTVNVKSNSEGEGAKGAVVTLKGVRYNGNYTAVVGEDGAVSFTDVIKDSYQLTIRLAGYEDVETSVSFLTDDVYETDAYLLKEIIVEPYNLKVEQDGEQLGNAFFSWNTTDPIEEGFEEYDDFTLNPTGSIGWTCIDGDGLYTYGFSNAEFTHMAEPMAFIVFNPASVVPSQTSNESLQPHSGSKFLASFAAFDFVGGVNNDWFISPELLFARDFIFSFYAKSYFEGSDYFSVGYSTESDINTDNFVWLDENVKASTESWVEYSYTIPASAKRVAIRNVSTDDGNSFILMIDDVKIGEVSATTQTLADSEPSIQVPAVTYEVYLDEAYVGETSAIGYMLENLTEGEHTAGVKAVYNSGESEMATITFNISTSGVNNVYGNSLNVYPNPTSDILNVEGEYTRLVLSNMSGAVVMMLDGKQSTIDVSSLPSGMYILTVINDNNRTRVTHKVSIVR